MEKYHKWRKKKRGLNKLNRPEEAENIYNIKIYKILIEKKQIKNNAIK